MKELDARDDDEYSKTAASTDYCFTLVNRISKEKITLCPLAEGGHET